MKIFVIDNFDSFTYNLVHIIEQYASEVKVCRNNKIIINEIGSFDKIVFSPGPGLPSEVKIMTEIIEKYKYSKPILGICLGHQAIAEYFGANIINMPEVNHGRKFETKIVIDDYIYKNIPAKFHSGRYHSWLVDKNNFPDNLEVTSIDNKDNIMSIRHKSLNIRGVQFHPESIMTEYGVEILKNWVNYKVH